MAKMAEGREVSERKRIIIVVDREKVPTRIREDLARLLREKMNIDCIIMAVATQSRPVEIYGIDNLTEIEFADIKRICEERK